MWGYHLICDCNQCNDAVKDADKIRMFTEDLLETIKMVGYGDPVIVRFAEHDPEAVGYSLVQLIETSAVTGHFSDNNLDAYLDIFSCAEFDPQEAMETIVRHFSPEQIYYQFIPREAKKGQLPGFQQYKGEQISGECSGCGACCCSDAYIIAEKDIAKWFDMHGYKYPMGCEQLAQVMINKIDEHAVKLIFFDKCENLIITEDGPRCSDYENRPAKCRAFPSSPEACKSIWQCSFNNKP